MTQPAMPPEAQVAARLRQVVARHFDPEGGSPYWIEKARRLGVDARAAIHTVEDLGLLGPMDSDALAARPIEDFIPRALLGRRAEFVVAETGGTLGRPRYAAYRDDEFEAAFVRPFVVAARRVKFPRDERWLFVGPSGPHVIGKAAVAYARAMGSSDPFGVDFDPRWAKKLPERSFAQERYLEHIVEQALRVLATQRIGVLFSTPRALESLGERVAEAERRRIRGIVFGGMPVAAALRERLGELYPEAVMLSGYGNTLFGMAPELAYTAQDGIDYFPHGTRLVIRLVEDGEAACLGRVVEYGRRGRVVVHRLDETQLVVNLVERDTAVRIPAPGASAAVDGFVLDGLRDPQPIVSATVRPALGLY